MKNKELFSKADIIEGLHLKQFEVYYQPIIDKQNDKIISGEALVRWNHPKLGFLHPASFIEIAEKNKAIIELGEFVLREACAQSRQWKDEGYDFHKVTVNLSFTQLLKKDFTKKTIQIIQESNIDPKDLELELTESVAMTDPVATRQILTKLQEIGVKITLDDFGTGYSNFSCLSSLPFDGLKMDGQFIQESLATERSSKLIRSIIDLARSINIHIVAEGVETKKQLNLLEEMDCHNVQGFYFTHPLPSKEYKEWCTFFLSMPRSAFSANY